MTHHSLDLTAFRFENDSPAAAHEPADLIGLENGPALWSALLARMPTGSVVAGGAVRDYLLGQPPKDIDIFFDVQMHSSKEDWSGFGPLGLDKAAEYDAMNSIAVVQRATFNGLQVDAIGLCLEAGPVTGERVVATFDFGLTRCWYDGEIHDTPEAKADREGKTVTLLLHDRPARAADRFVRFNTRMGGEWTFVSTKPEPLA